jgi:lipid A 3-O-deacylase
VKAAAVLAVVWLAAAGAEAGAQAWRPDGVYSQVGAGAATDAWSIGGQWHWKRGWVLRDSLVLHGRWEFSVGRWRTDLDDEGDRTWITQVSAVPTLRISNLSERGWYAELGSGPSLLMPVFRSRNREFSTELNFQSHLALGYVLGERGEHDFGVRIEHFSNAGIREPNPGMDFLSLRYTRRFADRSERFRLASAEEQTGDSTHALH